MNRTDGRQSIVDALFIATEAIVWYVMLHVLTTAMQQSYLSQVEGRLGSTRGGADIVSIVHTASNAEYGPSLLIVLATAFGGFALMRGLTYAGLDGALGAIVLLAASVVVLNVLLHIALVGDLRVWDPSGLTELFARPSNALSSVNLEALVRDANPTRPTSSIAAFEFMGMIVLWARFVVAGRGRVTFERMLRSFSIGFLLTIVGLALASIEGIRSMGLFTVPQFILGLLGLAVANNARTVAPAEGARRIGPWVASVGGTIAVLFGVALLLGTLAFLNVAALLTAVGDVAMNIVGAVLIAVLTPIFWVIERILDLLRSHGIVLPVNVPSFADLQPPKPDITGADAPASSVTMWLQNGLRFAAVMLICYIVYRLALIVMGRRRLSNMAVDEVRAQASSATGFGSLLRGMMSRVRGSTDDAWVRREPVYRLYARAAGAAEARGFRYQLGETPIEFTSRASRMMNAPPFPPIGVLFDRARYGRHVPDEGQVRSLAAALGAWEAATPATEELRSRLAGASPLSSAQEFVLGITGRGQAIAEQRARRRAGWQPPPPPPPPMDPMA